MRKIQNFKIMYSKIMLLIFLVGSIGFNLFNIGFLTNREGLTPFTIEQLVEDTKALEIKTIASSFSNQIDCKEQKRFNGLTWECGRHELPIDLVVTDNNGLVLMSDQIRLERNILAANKDINILSIIEPYKYNGSYILISNSNPLTFINTQEDSNRMEVNSQIGSVLEQFISTTPNIKDFLTLTTYKQDLTLTADITAEFNPSNIAKIHTWEFARADWEDIVNSSYAYVSYQNNGLHCNPNYLKTQYNVAKKLLCNEFVGTD